MFVQEEIIDQKKCANILSSISQESLIVFLKNDGKV